ncbi:MAG: carbohydrate kinase [Erysipelotrichaceae bacterium]|nr:carbohydrate kinase [Erysipelotrichaceae bacterium]
MNNTKYDVVSLGELLIDFTEYGISDQGNPLFEANPGGAPANVLAMLSRLRKRALFIGKVGNDGFGRQLQEALKEQSISVEGLYKDDEVHTTLALVHKLDNGDRDFSFYRKPGADVNLKPEEVKEDFFEAKIFHFGSLSMTDQPVKDATIKALSLAEKHGCILSFDPNLRPPLWDSLDQAKEEIAFLMEKAAMLKISDNEVLWFTGEEDYDAAINRIRTEYPQLKLICLTLGKEGSRAYYKDLRVEEAAFLSDKTVDTTGAGDTFCGCMLNYVLEHGLDDLREEELKEMLKFANAAASLITRKKGALRVMPEKEEVETLINETR